ncbi:MAG TPA: hypothetical protein VGQ51_11070 [Puia sp.]|nr:hypothetical protein [Puia sp.]
MKNLFLSLLTLPVAALIYSWTAVRPPDSVEIRSGQWPIHLERTTDRPGVNFSLIFRDQSETIENVLDTLDFADVTQLRYFDQGLSALKKGNNGDCARYKDYSITRSDKKFEGTYYILRADYGQTIFRQPEADIISKAIKEW